MTYGSPARDLVESGADFARADDGCRETRSRALTRHWPLDTCRRFIHDTYVTLGATPGDAGVVADVLVTADRFGITSHGIQRLGYYVERIENGVTRPGAGVRVVGETPSTAVIDGGHGLGHVIAARAMAMAIDKAHHLGLGAVAVRNSTHYGIAGYYALMASAQGQIGLTTTNARPCQAPTFGAEPMFGTNPLAFAAPTDEEVPFLYDAALSITQRGRIEVARRRGETIPEGVAITGGGETETDPATLLRAFVSGNAALLPLGGSGEATGGHKGYGLSLIVEILSAALQGGTFLQGLAGGDAEGTWRPYGTGHFFLAIDVAAFGDVEAFRRTTGDMMRQLRASRKTTGAARIYTAGEKEHEAARRADRDGVEIDDDLATELRALRDRLRLTGFDDM